MGFNLWLDESVPREESDIYVAAATDRKVTRPVPLHLQRACPNGGPDHEGAVRRRLLRAFRKPPKTWRGDWRQEAVDTIFSIPWHACSRI